MNGLASFENFKNKVDVSHKYTDVLSDDYIGPGKGHHHYLIVKKEDQSPLQMLNFQDGPIGETGINGIMDENLITIIIDRLQGFQSGSYSSRYNAIAITKLEEALMWLQKRTRDRESRGVEGTHKV